MIKSVQKVYFFLIMHQVIVKNIRNLDLEKNEKLNSKSIYEKLREKVADREKRTLLRKELKKEISYHIVIVKTMHRRIKFNVWLKKKGKVEEGNVLTGKARQILC